MTEGLNCSTAYATVVSACLFTVTRAGLDHALDGAADAPKSGMVKLKNPKLKSPVSDQTAMV